MKRQPTGIPTGGQFAASARPESEVQVGPVPAPKILQSFAWYYTGSADVTVSLDRSQMDYGVQTVNGSDPADVGEYDATDADVDRLLEQWSDDPEAFGREIGWPGTASWDSARSELDLGAADDTVSDDDVRQAVTTLDQILRDETWDERA